MPKFRISYEITGSVIVEAPNAEDAAAYFNREHSQTELGELGELEAFEPESEYEGLMRPIQLESVMDEALKEGRHG